MPSLCVGWRAEVGLHISLLPLPEVSFHLHP